MFAPDVATARQQVSLGVISVEEGIERADHLGVFGPRTKDQLAACLSRIANGECHSYQVDIN